jgi:D-citramalate synthase
MNNQLEIMDTTLRDGEQTSGVAFSATEKLSIAQVLLKELKVNRIEIASARVSEGEFLGVQKIAQWAKENNCLEKIEVLGFIDGNKSIDWINKAGVKVVNLLSKASLKHLKYQLRKTPQQHIADIKNEIEYANKLNMSVNLYLEDWSNGMIHDRDYVFQLIDALKDTKIKRFMLPDTLGILNPLQTSEFCEIMTQKYPDLHFDFHAHNDYDLATANVFMAIKAGIKGIHTTVNGLGERAGNVSISSVIGVINDHLKVPNSLDESKLTHVSRLVETFSAIRIPENKPIIGENVYTQTCGVHADGDTKNNLYYNDLKPERFGRTREYALGKTAGKANILKNLQDLGIDLEQKTIEKLTKRVIELGDKKENISKEDLIFILDDLAEKKEKSKPIKIEHYNMSLANGLRPMANINVKINEKYYEQYAVGDGQYDAFMKALWKIYDQLGKQKPNLTDYKVSIPPGGKTDALVHTIIKWEYKNKELKTHGLAPDQTEAAILATEKVLNIIENLK